MGVGKAVTMCKEVNYVENVCFKWGSGAISGPSLHVNRRGPNTPHHHLIMLRLVPLRDTLRPNKCVYRTETAMYVYYLVFWGGGGGYGACLRSK